MGRRKGSHLTQSLNKNQADDSKQTSPVIPYIPLIAAIVVALGYVIVAIINQQTAITTTLTPIEFTETAEAFHTSVAMETQANDALNTSIAITTQTANTIETTIATTETAEAKETYAVMTQTANALETNVAATNQAALTQAAKSKPIRHEYLVVDGEFFEIQLAKNFLVRDCSKMR